MWSEEGYMSRDNDTQTGLVLLAFVMGAVTGAAAALLWAPTTGEETRRYLNDRAREGRDRANDAAERGREFVRQQREQLATAVDRGRDVYERTRERATGSSIDNATHLEDESAEKQA